jgi:NADPH2:quinone reductase
VTLPATPGLEGAGEVVALGEGVQDLQVGDRVAYAGGPLGAYSEERLIPADRLVKLPDSLSFEQGAAMMLQGMTAQYLLKRTYPVRAGDTILVHAAAGGVGLILCQWAKALGATVIGTVSSEEKAALAKAHGCDHPIIYTREDFQSRVMEITGGAKVPVVYDSIGKDTFEKSLECLAPLGMMVLYGGASGPVPLFDLGLLAKMGSLFITRPTLFTYTAKRADLLATAEDLFDAVSRGLVKIEIHQRYALQDAAQAHRDLEARKTTGSTILTV